MRYLKLYESLGKEDPNKVAKLLYDYSKEYEQGEYFWDIDEIVRESMPEEPEYEDILSYEEMLSGITNLLNNRKTFGLVRVFDKLEDIYDDIENLMDNDLTIEEMEDYFLDMKDYNINRNRNGFVVNINNIDHNDVIKTFNRIWVVIGSRLPDDFYIQEVRILKPISYESVGIDVIISKKDQKEESI